MKETETPSSVNEIAGDIIRSIIGIQVSYVKFIRKHKTQIRVLQTEFMALIFVFDNFLKTIINNHVKTSHVLSNIISELKVAASSGTFNLIILSEIHDNCERLLGLRESDHQLVQNMEDDIFKLQRDVKKKKNAILRMTLEKSNGVATTRCTTEASNALITYLNYNPDNAELIAVVTGLAVMGAIIRFVNHCTLNGFTELVKDLKQLEDKIAFLTMHVESLEEIAAHQIQHQLQNYLQSTKKGIKYYSFNGERTKEQARKMIIETKELQRDYYEIFEQANQTRLYLKKHLV